jgi:Holin of 3TMs, for gene-transfer release
MWPALMPVLATLLEKLLPDPAAAANAKLELLRLAQTGELAQLTADTELSKAQIAVNLADANSGSNYRGGWRPFIGWVCGLALSWDWIIKQMVVTAWVMQGHAAPVLPALSTEQITGLLAALLGLGGYRTMERLKGKA